MNIVICVIWSCDTLLITGCHNSMTTVFETLVAVMSQYITSIYRSISRQCCASTIKSERIAFFYHTYTSRNSLLFLPDLVRWLLFAVSVPCACTKLHPTIPTSARTALNPISARTTLNPTSARLHSTLLQQELHSTLFLQELHSTLSQQKPPNCCSNIANANKLKLVWIIKDSSTPTVLERMYAFHPLNFVCLFTVILFVNKFKNTFNTERFIFNWRISLKLIVNWTTTFKLIFIKRWIL